MSKRNGKDEERASQGKIIQIDEAQFKGHLDEMVRGTVEEMLNGLLDAEAEQLCEPGDTSGAQSGRIPGPGIISGS